MIDIDFIRSVANSSEAQWARTTVDRLGPGFTRPTTRSNNFSDGRSSGWPRPKKVETERLGNGLTVSAITRADGSQFKVHSQRRKARGTHGGLIVWMVEVPARSDTRGVPGGRTGECA